MTIRPYFIISLLIVTMFVSLRSSADTPTALTYYERGELHYEQQEYDEALTWYRKAIELRSEDGTIVTQRDSSVKSFSYGRLAKKITTENITSKDYFPNQRISEINNIMAEQKRRANPPLLELQWITIREPTRDNILDGGETGTIVINIENKGKSPALDVKLDIQGDTQGLDLEREVIIGELKPQSAYVANIEVSAAHNVVATPHKITIAAKERSGFDSNILEVLLQTKPHRPSNITLEQIEVSDFNANDLIEPTESVTIKGVVTNNGAGVSAPLNLKLQLGENLFPIPGSEKTTEIGKIYPGESKTFEYSFITNRRIQHKQELPVELLVASSDGKQILNKELDLEMYNPQNTVSVNIQPKERTPEATSLHGGVDVDINIPQGTNKNADAVAVIIGNKNYQISGLPPVQYALNDARTVKKYLVKTLGFSEHNIIYIENATAARFNETFGSSNNFAGKLYNYVKPGHSDVFIYYSGHGAPDLQNKGAFFVPVDVDPNYIATSGYPLNLFYKNISKIPARNVTVVLDTCFSGNSDGGYLLRNISPALLQVESPSPVIDRAAIFTSSQTDQISTWLHEKKHGLFTYYFLKGLSGEADKNKDLSITTTELGYYLSNTVPFQARKLNGYAQTPALSQQKEMVVAEIIGNSQASKSVLP